MLSIRALSRLLGSLTLDDAPELRADAQEQLEELRVDGERLVGEELQHADHRAAGHHRNREARAKAELEPFGRSTAADAVERNHARRRAPAGSSETTVSAADSAGSPIRSSLVA